MNRDRRQQTLSPASTPKPSFPCGSHARSTTYCYLAFAMEVAVGSWVQGAASHLLVRRWEVSLIVSHRLLPKGLLDEMVHHGRTARGRRRDGRVTHSKLLSKPLACEFGHIIRLFICNLEYLGGQHRLFRIAWGKMHPSFRQQSWPQASMLPVAYSEAAIECMCWKRL